MALECNHNFRLDQMVWAQFSDNGGFWPAIISRDKKEPQKRWYIGNNIHVQFVSPPFVRACNQVIQDRWVDAYTELVSFELLKNPQHLFTSTNISIAYQEAIEIFKEGKALPRWVENVVITASKIKGCSIEEDDILEEEEDDDDRDSDMSPRTNLDPSCEVNGTPSFPTGRTNSKRKRSSEDSFSSDSLIADSNQNKKSRGIEKYGNHNNPREAINRNSEFLNENGEEEIEKVQNTVNGQSDAAAFRFMVKTEKGWSCKECEFTPAAKNENNCKQNLKRHVLVKHCEQVDIFCQYCHKMFRNLPSCEKHVSGCSRKYNTSNV